MELLNIQEQVQKNKEDIKQLKSGIKIEYFCSGLIELGVLLTASNIGKYALVTIDSEKHLYLISKTVNNDLLGVDMGVYPAVVKGDKGDKGDDGANGERGSNILGISVYPPSGAKVGDFYIQKKIVDGATDYVLNKLDESKTWRPQFSMRGPQGLPGISEEIVIANPEDEASDTLQKLDVHGVVYDVSTVTPNPDQSNNHPGLETVSINGSTYYIGGSWAKNLSYYLYEEDDNITSDQTIVATQGVIVPLVPSSNDYAASKSYVLSQAKIESLKDLNEHNRFISGEGTVVHNVEGVTLYYYKWALSGNHLMFVLDIGVDANLSISTEDIKIGFAIPEWLMDKIVPHTGNYVDSKLSTVSYNGYDAQTSYNAFFLWKNPNENQVQIRNVAIESNNRFRYMRVEFNLIIE